MAHRNRRTTIVRDLEVEVGVDVGVEIDQPALHELHNGGPGEELRGRARPEQRLVRINGRPMLEIRESIAAVGDYLALPDHGDDCARDVGLRQSVRHEPIEPGVDVGRSQLRWRGWIDHRFLYRLGSDRLVSPQRMCTQERKREQRRRQIARFIPHCAHAPTDGENPADAANPVSSKPPGAQRLEHPVAHPSDFCISASRSPFPYSLRCRRGS